MTTETGIAAILTPVFPSGIIWGYAGSSSPSGWILCDGSALSRTTYSDLFAAIGTTYGAGDGSTTFNIPDLKGRVIVGAGSGSGLTVRSRGDKSGAETHKHDTTSGSTTGSASANSITTTTVNHMIPFNVVNYIIKL